MAKCPACGFESPDSADWCDFCKEPFRRAAKAPDPQRQAEGPKKGIPAEFMDLDAGGKIPHAPPWLRTAAWAVLAAWFIVVMSLLGAYMARQNAQQQDRPVGPPSSSR